MMNKIRHWQKMIRSNRALVIAGDRWIYPRRFTKAFPFDSKAPFCSDCSRLARQAVALGRSDRSTKIPIHSGATDDTERTQSMETLCQ